VASGGCEETAATAAPTVGRSVLPKWQVLDEAAQQQHLYILK
jgi:hypothetical protein